MDEKKPIEFSLTKISTEQFALFEEAFDDKKVIDILTSIRFRADFENKIISAFTLFQFEQEKATFMVIEVGCHFLIEAASWDRFSDSTHKLKVDKGLLTHLAFLTVGTTRGVLHAKTEGLKFNEFYLPTINISSMINEDLFFD